MQLKSLVAFCALAGYAAASSCQAQNVLDKCLSDSNSIIAGCGQTDYHCLCQTNKDKLQCYINCPNDPGKGTQQSTVTSWCVAAGGDNSSSSSSATPSATSSATGSSSSPSATGSSTNAAYTGTSTATSSETSAPTTSSTSSKSGAASVVTANLALAGAAGLAALFF